MVEAKRIASRGPGAQIHESTRDHVALSWSNLACVVFKGTTTLGGVRAIQRVYDETWAKNPEGIYMMTIVEDRAPLPVVEVRDALATFLAGGAGKTIFSAVVQEGTGFRAAAVRGVVTGLAMVARMPYPHRVFGTPTEAARWFGTSEKQPIDAQDLVFAVADARERAMRMPSSSSPLGV